MSRFGFIIIRHQLPSIATKGLGFVMADGILQYVLKNKTVWIVFHEKWYSMQKGYFTKKKIERIVVTKINSILNPVHKYSKHVTFDLDVIKGGTHIKLITTL